MRIPLTALVFVLLATLPLAANDVQIEAPGPIVDALSGSGKLWMIVNETDGKGVKCGMFVAEATGTAACKRVRDATCTAVLSRLEPVTKKEGAVVFSGAEGFAAKSRAGRTPDPIQGSGCVLRHTKPAGHS